MRDIADILDRETAEGFLPQFVRLPRAAGCRVCGTEDGGIHVRFLGSRLMEEKVFVYAFVTLCGQCAASGETLRAAERMVADRFRAEGKGPETPAESPAPSG